ncbi:MAG: hypothetical protein E7552_02580 [Ruminococcaceae bacterium]|nr:hypothetical protein [Oscillospiraceae bacterium]
MRELREALALADERTEVVIYADAVGEWVDIPPYSERCAAVCGFFSAARVCMTDGAAVIMTGSEAAL